MILNSFSTLKVKKAITQMLLNFSESQINNINTLCSELEEKGVWVDLEEILVGVAKYLERRGLLQQSFNYYKRALHASRYVVKKEELNEEVNFYNIINSCNGTRYTFLYKWFDSTFT